MTDIRQLAEYLNLSVGTVSRALNNRPEVKEETRRRVQEAAKEMGYVPNQSGRSLRQGATRMLGFILNSTEINDRNSAIFFMGVVDGIQNELARHKLDLVVFTGSSGEDVLHYLQRIATRRIVDGIIIAETKRDDPRIRYLDEKRIPFVTFGRSDTLGSYNWVDIDFGGMARSSIDRFYAQGHRKIAVSTARLDLDLFYPSAYIKSYKQRMTELGLEVREDYIFICEENTKESGIRIAREIVSMADPPTAIINLDEQASVGLYQGLYGAGRMPGRDLAILGAIDPISSDQLKPRLSGYKVDLQGVGRAIGATLLAGMKSYSHLYKGPAENIVYPLTYIKGESDQFGPKDLGSGAGSLCRIEG